MNNFIVVGTCNNLIRQVLFAIRGFSDNKAVVIGGHNTRGLRWSKLCARHAEASFNEADDDHFLWLVNAFVRQMPKAVLIPADCEGARTINRVRERLPIRAVPLSDTATLDMFDDKWRFYQFCTEHELSTPETMYVGSKMDLDFSLAASRLGTPFVVKPVNQAGSQGVQVIHSEAQYEEAIRRNSAYQFFPLVAQRYVDGDDVCIDLLAVHGKVRALAFQQRVGGEIRFFPNKEMERLAYLLAATSSYNGVMNLDARIEHGSGKVFLLESNPRFWASLTASVGCGLNFVAESIAPAPRSTPVRMLTSGTFYLRHPIARPSSWKHLIADSGAHGRLLRARMSDLELLGDFTRSLSARLRPSRRSYQ